MFGYMEILDRNINHQLFDFSFECGIILHEVKSVLVKVITVQTCGDWSVFLSLTPNNGLQIN